MGDSGPRMRNEVTATASRAEPAPKECLTPGPGAEPKAAVECEGTLGYGMVWYVCLSRLVVALGCLRVKETDRCWVFFWAAKERDRVCVASVVTQR